MQMRGMLLLTLSLMTCVPRAASAQDVWIGGGVQYDVHRFAAADEDLADVPLRLDGESVGWTALAAFRAWNHLAISLEWAAARPIEDVRTLSLDVNGRPVTVTSTLAHTTRVFQALSGYTHGAGAHVRLSYLGGVAWTRVRREFTSNAADLVLVTPSNVRDPSTAIVVDDFLTWAGGADVRILVTPRLHVIGGLRAQPLRLTPDLSGWSVRTIVGAGLSF
jgi:hypothetical protein